MDTFFTLLKKSLVATMFIVFAFVATYIPQPYNPISEAEAGGVGGGSNVIMQGVQNVTGIATTIASTVSSGLDAVSSWAVSNQWIKENILDGIGWALAKALVSRMVSSLVTWINSGFEGRPAFVQDIGGFMRDTANQFAGEYIQSLGGIGSFVCSPFQLDIQIALDLPYRQNSVDQPAPTCTLSGIIDNIEGFIDGGSFQEGGWKDWFRITATPQTYTPYGSAIAAQAGLRAGIINAQGEEMKLLDFGAGFLSSKHCETIDGKEECSVVMPGQTIADALTLNLDSGRQTLIQADEFNEIITALLGQLANTAITGAKGLLGLSPGTGYTESGYDGGSFTSQLVADAAENFDFVAAKTLFDEGVIIQEEYRDLAFEYEPKLQNFTTDTTNTNENERESARIARDEAREALRRLMTGWKPSAPWGVISLTPHPDSILGRLATMETEWDDPTTNNIERLKLAEEYGDMDLYTRQEILASQKAWDLAIREN